MLFREIIKIETKKGISTENITKKVKDVIFKSDIDEGLCNIYFMGEKGGLKLMENERMMLEDLKRMLKDFAPEDKMYQRPKDSFAYLRASFMEKELTIPISNRKLILDDWAYILFWEFSENKKEREIIITIHGE